MKDTLKNFFKKVKNTFVKSDDPVARRAQASKRLYAKSTKSHKVHTEKKRSFFGVNSTKLLKIAGNTLVALFVIMVLILSIRGIAGNPSPTELNRLIWKDNGPLELSPERGRYALMYALAEEKSFSFSPDLARFAAPDVAFTDGKYVSLFAPAVSFLVIPGYFIGKYFGLAQVGSYAVIALFALANLYLIRAIAIRIGAHPIAATIAGVAFLFATPAFAYAVTLYQHHISTFLILMGIYLLIRFNSIWSLMGIWLLCALSISVDYPNFFMMLPIGIAALGKVFIAKRAEGKITFTVPILRVLSVAVMVIPLAFFLWFNSMSYGNPLQLSGTIERAIEVRTDGSPILESEKIIADKKAKGEEIPQGTYDKNVLNFFQSRLLLNGLYSHFVSPDRGLLAFTPVMLFGIAGMVWAIKKRVKHTSLFVAIIGFNILLYSMWSDPYGGWAFGSRYLIPAYALLAVFIAYLLTRLHKYSLFLLFFFMVMSYSVAVNTLGAVTTNRNPPMVEAVGLSEITGREELYTYMRNVSQLNNNISKSYVFEAYVANKITAWQYYIFLTSFIVIVSAFILMTLRIVPKGEQHAL
ncbi:MAG: hypothetical protein H0W89_02125 [Candidatus Levybacteria bacterium]|nr:hypothetical protein [Candidatus Levybacteria bacterium]